VIATGPFSAGCTGTRDSVQTAWETTSVQLVSMHVRKWDYAYGRPVVSEIVGLLWWGAENGWCIVGMSATLTLPISLICVIHLCASTNHIRLTAGCYRSIALTIYMYAVTLTGGPAGLRLCGTCSRLANTL